MSVINLVPMDAAAKAWIEKLGLMPHPEGGYFKESYRSAEQILQECLPKRFTGQRSFSTAIYFLLPGGQPSRLHRLKSDEIWHFYAGTALTLHILDPRSSYSRVKLGLNPHREEFPQAAVPAGSWLGATVDDARSFALVGCTVSPGFDFGDFELASGESLIKQFPEYAAVIGQLT